MPLRRDRSSRPTQESSIVRLAKPLATDHRHVDVGGVELQVDLLIDARLARLVVVHTNL